MARSSHLKQYKLVELIGRGGMGEVWLARHEMLDREVAIKLIRPAAAGGGENALRRFEREARATSGLHSPHTVQIYDFGITDDGVFFTVMELLHGVDLRTVVETYGPLQAERVAFILRQVCDSLAEAHHNGLIHRDIKPANIFLCQLGLSYDFVKVLDFGLVKTAESSESDVNLSSPDRTVGTPAFMPPEIARGANNVDARADLYSVGCVAYFLLTGQPPFEGDNAMQVMVAHLEQKPETPSMRSGQVISKKFEGIIMDLLEKKPENRPQSAREVAERLARLSFEEPWTEERAERWWRMHRPLWLVREPMEGASGEDAKLTSRSPFAPVLGMAMTLLLAVAAGAALTFVGLRFFGEQAPAAKSPVEQKLEPLELGMSAAFSGPNRDTGRALHTGALAHLHGVNDDGGIGGRALTLVALDDGQHPKRARAVMVELLGKRRVFAAIGAIGDPLGRIAVKLALRSKTPILGAVSVADTAGKQPPNRYLFSFRPGDTEEIKTLVGHLTGRLGLTPEQIAVFTRDDVHGERGYRKVVKALGGGDPEGEEAPLRIGYRRNGIAVKEAAGKVASARERIRAVVMLSGYRPAASLIRTIEAEGMQPVFALVSAVNAQSLLDELRLLGGNKARKTRQVLITQVVPDPFSSSTGVIRYREHLQRYFPQEKPGFISLEGYVAASIMTEALRRATAPDAAADSTGAGIKPSPRLTRERLVDSLESIDDLDLGIGAPIRFGPSDHQGSDRVWLMRLDRRGRFVSVDSESDLDDDINEQDRKAGMKE